MDRTVVWSIEAEKDLNDILDFYYNTVQAKSYAQKLNRIFEKEIMQIKSFPKIGIATNVDGIRVKFVGYYSLIYEITAKIIYVLRIWDNRQNPLALEYRSKNKS